MSFEKSPIAHSWLCIPGYVTHENSNILFLAMSFLALSCANTREPIPGYVECENPYSRFLAMSFLSTSCKIFHFSFLAMSKNRFLAMSFLAMYGHPPKLVKFLNFYIHHDKKISMLKVQMVRTHISLFFNSMITEDKYFF
jgi:hypothetical protein